MSAVCVVNDIQFIDQLSICIDEEGPLCANLLTKLVCDFGIVHGDSNQLAVIDSQFGLQVFDIVLQLENILWSILPPPENDNRWPTSHKFAQFCHLAILIGEFKVWEDVPWFQIFMNFHFASY